MNQEMSQVQIKSIMNEKNISKRKLARDLGYKFITVKGYLSAKRPMPARFVEKASKLLLQNESIEQTVEQTNLPDEPSALEKKYAEAALLKLSFKFSRLKEMIDSQNFEGLEDFDI